MMIPVLVQNGKRLLLDKIPRDVLKGVILVIEECWDHEPDKRPNFSGNLVALWNFYFQSLLNVML